MNNFELKPSEYLDTTDLPFVRDTAKGRFFWHVEPSGDYSQDCNTGERYALLYLAHNDFHAQNETNSPLFLQWIIFDMLEAMSKRKSMGKRAHGREKKHSGIEVGFLGTITHYASLGHNFSVPPFYFKNEEHQAAEGAQT